MVYITDFLKGMISMKIYYPYINLIVVSIVIYITILILKWIFKKLSLLIKDDKKNYEMYTTSKLILNIILIILLAVTWNKYLHNIITLLSVTVAAILIAVRDVILNLFCGIYIKAYKPFKLEDRIKTRDIIGDVISINFLSFELLEVSDKDEHGLSTGVIVRMPASTIIKNNVKNLTKGFKYIWDEMEIVF